MRISDFAKIPNPINGVLEVNVRSWEGLRLYTSLFASHKSHIFRGQANSNWPLITTLDRGISNLRYGKYEYGEFYRDKDFFNVYKFLLNKFKESLRGRGVNFKDMSNDELWALGQHYGLHTPLLDWSYSFYIALFFAFTSEKTNISSKSSFRSVYALGVFYEEFKTQMDYYNKEKEGYTKFKIVESTSNDNPRVINQAGLFTKLPFRFDISQWTEDRFRGESQRRYFIKINIPDSERGNILQELDLMNINSKTVYPDLIGSALDCNYRLLTLPIVA